MVALLSLAEADPRESRSTDIEMTASQFAGAHWSRRSLPAARSMRKLRLQKRARPAKSAIPSFTQK